MTEGLPPRNEVSPDRANGFRRQSLQILSSGKFWQIASGVLALLAIGLAAAQMNQAASIQKDSAELSKRTMIGGLALEAHGAAYEMLSTLTRHYSDPKSMEGDSDSSCERTRPLPDAIHIAIVRLDGAIARAGIIDDEPIRQCLHDMRAFSSTVAEFKIPCAKSLDTGAIAIAFDQFPAFVERYIDGASIPEDQQVKADQHGNPSCPFMSELLTDETADSHDNSNADSPQAQTSKPADEGPVSAIEAARLTRAAAIAERCGLASAETAKKTLRSAIEKAGATEVILKFSDASLPGFRRETCPSNQEDRKIIEDAWNNLSAMANR